MGKFINTCTAASPSQAECDNAIRNMQGGKHTLNNAITPVNKASYHQCIDIIKKQSKKMGEGMGKLGGTVKGKDQKAFTDALQQVAGAVNTLIEASAQSAYLVSAGDSTSKPGVNALDEMPDIQKSLEVGKDNITIFLSLSGYNICKLGIDKCYVDIEIFILLQDYSERIHP